MTFDRAPRRWPESFIDVQPAPIVTCHRSSRSLARRIVAVALLGTAALTPAVAADANGPTAFVHVNVVPMDGDGPRVLRDQTVVIEHGLVSAMGHDVAPPQGARIVDGHGSLYLSPGLADLHTHAESADDMKLYLAFGVTSVLHMGGASTDFMDQRRPLLAAGQRPGPHVYAAFRIDGTPEYGQFVVRTPDEARWITRLAKANGYDFIKVYNNLSPECFEATVDEARRQGMAVVGHGITRVGLERQLALGQKLVAHAEEFFYTTFGAASTPADPNAAPEWSQVPPAIEFVRRSGAFVTADLATYQHIAQQWGRPDVLARWLQAPETAWLSPDRRLAWRKEDYVSRPGSIGARAAFLQRFVRALQEAGVPLVAGTDAPAVPGMMPGISLHEDLRALHEAGFSPFEALATATRNAGRFIRETVPGAVPFGEVAPGFRADLVLTEVDPLEDLATLRAPLGVMSHGVWYDREKLSQLLEGIARDYRDAVAGPPERQGGRRPPVLRRPPSHRGRDLSAWAAARRRSLSPGSARRCRPAAAAAWRSGAGTSHAAWWAPPRAAAGPARAGPTSGRPRRAARRNPTTARGSRSAGASRAGSSAP
jgi:hypothetical protein